MSLLKKIASYIWDIPIEKSSSPQNKYLEVVWSMGRKMLNTKNANYSFGNGYKVFEYAFAKLKQKPKEGTNILVLGFGVGSVEHILRKQYKINKPRIAGVEYDAEIIRLYHKHFQSVASDNLELNLGDAKEYIRSNNQLYDLIIIDLFDDLETIGLVFEKEFNSDILNASSENASIIYNTVKNPKQQLARTELCLQLSNRFRDVQVHEFQDINQIIIAQ